VKLFTAQLFRWRFGEGLRQIFTRSSTEKYSLNHENRFRIISTYFRINIALSVRLYSSVVIIIFLFDLNKNAFIIIKEYYIKMHFFFCRILNGLSDIVFKGHPWMTSCNFCWPYSIVTLFITYVVKKMHPPPTVMVSFM
jgi:hypothetical protein